MSIMDAPLPGAQQILQGFHKMADLNGLEKAAITSAAYRLPPDKINYLRKCFEKMDTNGDGVLSAQELQDGLRETGMNDDELMNLLKNIDVDGSGVIEYTEFIAATYDFQRKLHEDVTWAAFRVFDQDGSGSVTSSELKKVLSEREEIGEAFGTSGVQDLLNDFDANGDGEIDYQEFLGLLQAKSGRRSSLLALGNDLQPGQKRGSAMVTPQDNRRGSAMVNKK